MKLVSLNTWGGKAFKPLMNFLKEKSGGTDVFCFQEVFHTSSGVIETHGARANLYHEISLALPDFQGYFAPSQDNIDFAGPVDFELSLGKATFIKKSFPVKSWGDFFVYREGNAPNDIMSWQDLMKKPSKSAYEDLPRNVLYVRTRAVGKPLTICNFHGIAFPGSKLDTQSRLKQSNTIEKFLEGERGRKILCGDFNLLPDTKSLAILENRMVNLVKKFGIARTRSRLSPYYGKENEQKFADYLLVSPDIKICNFEVPDVAVSDHLPLVLEFS